MSLSGQANAQPLVSACLLTYRRANVLERTIGDILAQDFTDFELIINDDCSPDHTAEIGRRAEARDPRVRYCRNERNLRYAGNQNAAVTRSRGKYVAFLHDGDRYRPDMLSRWVEALEKHPSAGLVFNNLETIEEQGNSVRTIRHPYPPLVCGRELYLEMLRRNDSPIFGIAMARKKALEEAGPFREEFPVLADVDMWFRILFRRDAAFVAEPLFRVYPREAGHINRSINWKIREEDIHIRLRAAEALWPAGSRQREDAKKAVLKMYRRPNLRWLLAALARGRPGDFVAGVAMIRRLSLPWNAPRLPG